MNDVSGSLPTISCYHPSSSSRLIARSPCGRNELSRLKKNDYGQGGYHDHFWFAFYDPAAGSKIKSFQLYFVLNGRLDRYDFGFSTGDDCEPYIARLVNTILKIWKRSPNSSPLRSELSFESRAADSPRIYCGGVGRIRSARQAG